MNNFKTFFIFINRKHLKPSSACFITRAC